MQNSAKKLVEKQEDAVKLEKQLDDLVEKGQISRKQADEFAEHLDEVATKGVFSKINGLTIDSKLLKKLQKEFEIQGGELKFDEESFAYIASRENVMNTKIEAITFNEELIFLNKNASTSAVYEELIHAEQFRSGKYNNWASKYGAEGAENLMEKEAAEELLRNAKEWKLPEVEIELIKERLKYFNNELKRLKI